MQAVEAFLKDIDAGWPAAPATPAKTRLTIIGSTALMLRTPYVRGTKDSDVLETDALTGDIRDRLITLAGPETRIHARHRMYIDVVPRGLTFRRQQPAYHRLVELSAALRHFDVEVMGVLDVVVSKLARFNANDRSDIDAMVERELVPHGDLVACFNDAIDFKMGALMEDEFDRLVEHLNTVERDMLGVQPTDIELPLWIR